jgi:hypothetical protein
MFLVEKYNLENKYLSPNVDADNATNKMLHKSEFYNEQRIPTQKIPWSFHPRSLEYERGLPVYEWMDGE